MIYNFPRVAEYNQAIIKNQDKVLNTLTGVSFIPSRKVPILVYNHGTGSFAVVFKVNYNNEQYALRCFLTSEYNVYERYEKINNFFHSVNEDWKINFEFLTDEINISGKYYPIIKMEWINGVPINEFVTKHIHEHNVLLCLQEKLVDLAKSLTQNNIGHGDLQSGNILVIGETIDFKLKLIDYDGVYIPDFKGQMSQENGRSEYQHPKKTKQDFNERMDWFSIWVMITAIEAVKFDKGLWNQVMQGGFNTLDNFLFTASDFVNPEQSKLFNFLLNKQQNELTYYVEKLKTFCKSNTNCISIPLLANSYSLHQDTEGVRYTSTINTENVRSENMFTIFSNIPANVLTSMLKKIGVTPITLEKTKYINKIICVCDHNQTKVIRIQPGEDQYEVTFI